MGRRHGSPLLLLPPLNSQVEDLRDVICMDVMHELGAAPGHLERLTGRERLPHGWIGVAERIDRLPPRADDVPGMDRCGEQASGGGLLLEHPRDAFLLDAVLVERRSTRTFGDRQLVTGSVSPQRTTVHQVAHLTVESFDQRPRGFKGEANQVDDDVRVLRENCLAERAFGVFPLPIGHNLLHELPLCSVGIGPTAAAADVDDLVACLHEARYEEGADVATSTDDDDAHDSPNSSRRR
jgi:hypothetical protein